MGHEIVDLPAPMPDQRIAYGTGAQQFGELRLPPTPGPHPVVIALHGGFWRARWDLTYLGHLCAALTAAGFATWSLEYRRLDREGGWPTTLLDAAAGADYVRTLADSFPLDLSRLVAMGHSAGGHLALWLGARARLPAGHLLHTPDALTLRGILSLAGVSDLQRGWEMRLGDGVIETFMGGPPPGVPERYAAASPAALLPLGVPQVLVHGTADEDVPYALSEGYRARARALGDRVRLLTLAGGDHFAPVDPRSSAWPRLLRATRSLTTVR